jgi:hypothetical protein
MSYFNDVDYKLPAIQHQSYLFQNKYFSQELLSIERNQDKKISFLCFLIDYLILLTFLATNSLFTTEL